jgi:1-acyl-sn-glycerol-3-phosphate acyltransferase
VTTRTYRLAQCLSFVYFKTFHRFEVNGLDNIPEDGAFLLASNHISFLDPPALGCKINRNLHYFARDSLFVGPLGLLIRRLNSIPVNRGQLDLRTLKLTLSVLNSGEPLLVFPEGTRSLDGNLGKPKKGIGLLIDKAKCPVVPARIRGSFEILGKGKIFPRLGRKLTITYGRLISYEELSSTSSQNDRRTEISNLVMEAIRRT